MQYRKKWVYVLMTSNPEVKHCYIGTSEWKFDEHEDGRSPSIDISRYRVRLRRVVDDDVHG